MLVKEMDLGSSRISRKLLGRIGLKELVILGLGLVAELLIIVLAIIVIPNLAILVAIASACFLVVIFVVIHRSFTTDLYLRQIKTLIPSSSATIRQEVSGIASTVKNSETRQMDVLTQNIVSLREDTKSASEYVMRKLDGIIDSTGLAAIGRIDTPQSEDAQPERSDTELTISENDWLVDNDILVRDYSPLYRSVGASSDARRFWLKGTLFVSNQMKALFERVIEPCDSFESEIIIVSDCYVLKNLKLSGNDAFRVIRDFVFQVSKERNPLARLVFVEEEAELTNEQLLVLGSLVDLLVVKNDEQRTEGVPYPLITYSRFMDLRNEEYQFLKNTDDSGRQYASGLANWVREKLDSGYGAFVNKEYGRFSLVEFSHVVARRLNISSISAKVGTLFILVERPTVRLLEKKLNELQAEYLELVDVVLVFSTDFADHEIAQLGERYLNHVTSILSQSAIENSRYSSSSIISTYYGIICNIESLPSIDMLKQSLLMAEMSYLPVLIEHDVREFSVCAPGVHPVLFSASSIKRVLTNLGSSYAVRIPRYL